MTDRVTLRSAAVAALKAAATLAGASVYSPLDWPTWSGLYPLLIVRTPGERKAPLGAALMGAPQFNSTITLSVVGRVEATTEAAAETALETLSLQIENALLTNAQFIRANEVQQFLSVDASMKVTAEGRQHIGETEVVFEIEVFQLFAPALDAAGAATAPGTPFTEIQTTVENPTTGVTTETFDTPLPQ